MKTQTNFDISYIVQHIYISCNRTVMCHQWICVDCHSSHYDSAAECQNAPNSIQLCLMMSNDWLLAMQTLFQ